MIFENMSTHCDTLYINLCSGCHFASIPSPTLADPVSPLPPFWSCSWGQPASSLCESPNKPAHLSLRIVQTTLFMWQWCPPSPPCWTRSFSASSKEWNSLPPSGMRPLLVPLSCSRQIFPAWLLLWLRVTYWYIATWRQRWNHPVFFLDENVSA